MEPVLFTLPGLDWEVRAYGFFLGLAIIVGWILVSRMLERAKLEVRGAGTNYVVSVASALVAGRLAWWLIHGTAEASLWSLPPEELAPGAAIVTGLLVTGGLAARAKVPVGRWYDVLTPAIAVGVVLERVGAFLAGVRFGIVARDWPMAVRFPAGSPPFQEHRRALSELLGPEATSSLPVHPTQLYGAALAVLGLGLVAWLWRYRRVSGQVIVGYGIYALLARAFVELPLRWEANRAETRGLGPLSGPQLWSLFVVGCLGFVLYMRLRGARRRAPSTRSGPASRPRGGAGRSTKTKGRR